MQGLEKTLKFEVERNDKAVIYIKGDDGADISCMIDTGANVPMWFMGVDFLKLRFPNAYKTDKLTIIHGLGKEPLMDVPVWVIPQIELVDDSGETITFHDVMMPVIEAKQYSFNMLIPLTMLNRSKFIFDYRISANYGCFIISTDKDDFYIRPIYVKDNNKYLNKIQAFFNDELT